MLKTVNARLMKVFWILMLLMSEPFCYAAELPPTLGTRELIEKALENRKLNDSDTGNFVCSATQSIKIRGIFNRIIQRKTVSDSYHTGFRDIPVILEINGKQLPPEEVENERKRACQALENGQESMKTIKSPLELSSNYKSVVFSAYEIFRRMEFFNRRIDSYAGRPAIVLEMRPLSKPQPSLAGRAYLDKLFGIVWIDQEDLLPVKLRIYLAPHYPASEEVFAEDWVCCRNHKWRKSYLHLNTTMNPKLFNGEYIDWILTMNNYSEFIIEEGSFSKLPQENASPSK